MESSLRRKGRFRVVLVDVNANKKVDLIIPMPFQSTLYALRCAAVKRALVLNFDGRDEDPVAHLGSIDGGILFEDDTLEDLIVSPNDECIYFVFGSPPSQTDLGYLIKPKTPTLRIRIITPNLARRNKRIEDIPILESCQSVQTTTTLRTLKSIIAESLGISITGQPHSYNHEECNCLLALKIFRSGTKDLVHAPTLESKEICAICDSLLNNPCPACNSKSATASVNCPYLINASCRHKFHSHCCENVDGNCCPAASFGAFNHRSSPREYVPSDQSRKFLTVVYGKSNLIQIPLACEADTKTGLMSVSVEILQDHLRSALGEAVKGKVAKPFGTKTITNSKPQWKFRNYSVVAICSQARHASNRSSLPEHFDVAIPTPGNAGTTIGRRQEEATTYVFSPQKNEQEYDLDIHTADAPISSPDEEITLDTLQLEQCAVNGIVNLFITIRVETKVPQAHLELDGMDRMFSIGDHWLLPVNQTERGIASYLSSMRVFAAKIADAKASIQNAILHFFMHFTHFPPVLRSLYTLLKKRTLSHSESAVLVQCIYEMTKDLVPPVVIENKEDRVLEGSRLLLNLALELAKNNRETTGTAYLDSMKDIILFDTDTFEPLVSPVCTNLGVIEETHFQSYKEGLLHGLADVTNKEPNQDEKRVCRLVRFSGGTLSNVTLFDSDALQLLLESSQRTEPSILQSRDLNYNFQELCSQSGNGPLAVLNPMSLRTHSIQEPALTLDGDGFLAVYVGRPPCAPPDKDVAIFRPTRGGEISIDVSDITQHLEPILEERGRDGSIVLDSLGDGQGKANKPPEEIVVICVDCSRSMMEPAGFEGLNESEDVDADTSNDNATLQSEDEEDVDPIVECTIDEGKEILRSHEAYEDMIDMVRQNSSQANRECAAMAIIASIRQLYQQEYEYLKEQEDCGAVGHTNAFLRTSRYRNSPRTKRMDKLKQNIRCLTRLDTVLADYLVAQSAMAPMQVRSELVNVGRRSPGVSSSIGEEENDLVLPREFQCPISYELLSTPVVAEDGFTYEKSQIEQWFRVTSSSPLTGLPIGQTLTPNRNLSIQIREWLEGKDLLSASDAGANYQRRTRRQFRKIHITHGTSSWQFRLPSAIPIGTLKALCFRCLRGEIARFTMLHNGEPIAITANNTLNLRAEDTISIREDVHQHRRGGERVLVKVYTHRDSPALSYWLLEDTQKSAASILFRFWHAKSCSAYYSPDKWRLWANIAYVGDGTITGNPMNAWDSLDQAIASYKTEGVPGSEPLYEEDSTPDREESVNSEDPNSPQSRNSQRNRIQVFKLRLFARPQNTKKKRRGGNSVTFSRMDVVKQVFENYINRTLAYGFNNHIGLITFSKDATVKQKITGVVENFRASLKNITCGGDTALWDSLELACEVIDAYGQQHPTAKKRIICLSDGADTKSKLTPWEVCQHLKTNGIIVDSICIGPEDNTSLRSISYGTGGYKFCPHDLESAVAMCELETVLSQAERPEASSMPPLLHGSRAPLIFKGYADFAAVDIVNEDTYPQRKKHPNLEDEFTALSRAFGKPRNMEASSGTRRLGGARILSEMRVIITKAHPWYDVYVSDRNIRFWKVVMEAPPDSAYAGGTYLLFLDMDEHYPSFAPKARFVTQIMHPNINKDGRICHSILDRNWTTDTQLSSILDTIWSLLLVPDKSDFANMVTSLNYMWDEVDHQERVKKHVSKHAKKSRADWRAEIEG